jgi:hypothetical protein
MFIITNEKNKCRTKCLMPFDTSLYRKFRIISNYSLFFTTKTKFRYVFPVITKSRSCTGSSMTPNSRICYKYRTIWAVYFSYCNALSLMGVILLLDSTVQAITEFYWFFL